MKDNSLSRVQLLYHSFPRRKAKEGRLQSVAVLESILDLGLLITPEIVHWRASDGRGFRVSQKRICLTSLEEAELAAHTKLFGPITLGFQRDMMEEIGAVPVFYVPRSLGVRRKKRNLGGFHLERLYQILHVVKHVRESGVAIEFEGTSLNLQDIENFARYLPTLFYPIEDIEGGQDRFYLAQKEWRIPGNLIYGGKPLSRRLNEVEAEEVRRLDIEFFDRLEEFPTGTYRLIEQCMLLPRIGQHTIGEAVARVVAPSELIEAVKRSFQARNLEPEFVELA